jgi:hypothetical protein
VIPSQEVFENARIVPNLSEGVSLVVSKPSIDILTIAKASSNC